jgi:hypothetical protein
VEYIKLQNEKWHFALVDDDIYEIAKNFRWYYLRTGLKKYVMANELYLEKNTKENYIRTGWKNKRKFRKKYRTLYLHHLVIPKVKRKTIDHINGNTLDNRRENLRCVTYSENQLNAKLRIDNTTGYKGILMPKGVSKKHPYYCQIYLGPFETIIHAAVCYKVYYRFKELGGEIL